MSKPKFILPETESDFESNFNQNYYFLSEEQKK
jgi:hypothetical protein